MVAINTVIKVTETEPPRIPVFVAQQDTWNRRVAASVNGQIGVVSGPVGLMFGWPSGVNAPSGCLLCDGSTLDAASFPALFAVIGTTYGSNSAGTFKLPDLRGTASVGEAIPPAQPVSGGSVTTTDTAPGTTTPVQVVTGGRTPSPRNPYEQQQ